jgi:hypothetical protein
MATKYWGRYKIGGKWSTTWHQINGVLNHNEAYGKFIKGTRFKPSEIQITTKEPKKYAGKYGSK